MFRANTQVPTRIYAPAAAKDFAIAHPYPFSSAIPAINALFPLKSMESLEGASLSVATTQISFVCRFLRFSSQFNFGYTGSRENTTIPTHGLVVIYPILKCFLKV